MSCRDPVLLNKENAKYSRVEFIRGHVVAGRCNGDTPLFALLFLYIYFASLKDNFAIIIRPPDATTVIKKAELNLITRKSTNKQCRSKKPPG